MMHTSRDKHNQTNLLQYGRAAPSGCGFCLTWLRYCQVHTRFPLTHVFRVHDMSR